ncbi:MAG: bifunctional helix-turn-helix transcriptional regulator/GNAT family N-acetyltransferase [Candidatus Acidiferrales bacterium]
MPQASIASPELDRRIAAVRRLNRFYTRKIGVLSEGLWDSPFSLTEVRLLYELAHRENLTASDLARELGLDAGYLSRILSQFEKQGYLKKLPSENDGRQTILSLTAQGREVFAPLEARSNQEIARILRELPGAEQASLVGAMSAIEKILGEPGSQEKVAYILRPHQPGDMGWVAHRHGILYSREYGWDEQFEALVAEIVAKFVQNFDPKKERCWIAERDGEIIGSVFVVKQPDQIAKLRLLYVEPAARGLGIGRRLVEECIRFARQTGYRKITLWTQSNLTAARAIYEKTGFRLVKEEPNHSFGHDLVSETWELDL